MRNFIRRTAAALAVLCMAALLLGTPTEAEERTYSAGGEAVGYYAGWAARFFWSWAGFSRAMVRVSGSIWAKA